MKILLLVLAFAAAPALAQDAPMPRMFQGMKGEKGQWEVEVLGGGGRAGKGMKITTCADNLMASPASKDAPRASGCKHRLLKDTPDEAVMESVCPERKTLITLKREGAKSMLMTLSSSGARGEREMKMRYTHLGPCREGQGTVAFDKDSEQCRKMKAQAAKMDPVKQCARVKSDREVCEQRVRDAAAQLSAMCN
jgi:hypothetical protein